jgi:phage terminase large subunit GpA-like protein
MNKSDLIAIGRSVLRPSDSGDIVEWLEANVHAIPDSPMPGPFRSDRTPWIAEALRIAADPETRMMTVLASIQSGKSLFARLFTCHIIANAPGPCMVLQANDPEAKDFAIRYLRPVWKNCPPVLARLKDEDMERSTTADFDRMTVYCRGIWNESNLQRLSLRYVIADECWLAPPSHLVEASARVTAFGWMGKRIFMSQGGKAGQEFHQLHETTDQRDWNFVCPHCQKLQPWVWEQVRFPEEAKEAGIWNLSKVAKGTTYECSGCLTRLPDTNASRYEANFKGQFVATSISANTGHVGLHWNSLATMSWGELGVMMLKAKEANDLYGDDAPRRVFKQKRLAMPWSEEGGDIVNLAEASDYALADDWANEAVVTPRGKVVEREGAPEKSTPFRTAGVDVQRGHFWVVVRRWATSGHSRLMAFAKIETWGNVESFLKTHGVHPAFVMVDSGDNTQEVYREATKRRWKCAKGSGNEDFAVTDKNGRTIRRFYSEKQRILVPGLAERAELISWSNLAGKDLLHGLRSRKVFTFPRDASADYVDQLNAEVRVKDKRSGKPQWILPAGKLDNHALDCELLALLSAVRWGIVGKEASETDLPSA